VRRFSRQLRDVQRSDAKAPPRRDFARLTACGAGPRHLRPANGSQL